MIITPRSCRRRNGRGVVAAHVLVLPLLDEVVGVERLEPDEEASESRIHGALEKARREHGVHRAGGLPETAHAAHALEQRRGEAAIAEQVIVEEVQVTAGQALDLGQRRIDGLRVEGPPAFEERLLVAEVAHVRAAARDDDGVRDEVEPPLDQVAPDRRKAGQRPKRRLIDALRAAAPEVAQEPRPCVLAGPEEDRVGVRAGLVGQRRHVQPAKRHVGSAGAVVVRDAIGPVRGGDVDLNDDQVRRVIQVERLHVLVLNLDVVVFTQVRGQRREAERREQRGT